MVASFIFFDSRNGKHGISGSDSFRIEVKGTSKMGHSNTRSVFDDCDSNKPHRKMTSWCRQIHLFEMDQLEVGIGDAVKAWSNIQNFQSGCDMQIELAELYDKLSQSDGSQPLKKNVEIEKRIREISLKYFF